MIGRWKGSSIATGHVLDGMLEAYHWYGKEFSGQDEVLPLLFGRQSPVAINPRFLPLNRVTAKAPALLAREEPLSSGLPHHRDQQTVRAFAHRLLPRRANAFHDLRSATDHRCVSVGEARSGSWHDGLPRVRTPDFRAAARGAIRTRIAIYIVGLR